MNLELRRLIDQVSRDKGIDKELLISAIKDAIRSAAKKKYGPKMDIEVEYRDDTGAIEVFQYKEVVTEMTGPRPRGHPGRKPGSWTRNANWGTSWASKSTRPSSAGLRPSPPSRSSCSA
jgi:hypothetical protein